MSTDTPPTDDAEAPTDDQLGALADRVIDRTEQRGGIDADGLVGRSLRRGILKALGAGALGAGVVGGRLGGAPVAFVDYYVGGSGTFDGVLESPAGIGPAALTLVVLGGLAMAGRRAMNELGR